MENFDNVQVGDKIIVHRMHWGNSVVTVTKVTKASFEAGGTLYYKKNGWAKGADAWSGPWATVATEEEIERITEENRRINLVAVIKCFDFNKLSTDELITVYNIVHKYNRKEKEE